MEEENQDFTEQPEDAESVLSRRNTIEFDDQFDYKPLKKGMMARITDSVFKLVPRKKKIVPVRPPVQMVGNAAKPLGRQPPTIPKPKMTPGAAMEKQILGRMPYAPRPSDVNVIIDSGLSDMIHQEPITNVIKNDPYPTPATITPPAVSAKKRRFSIMPSSISKLNVLINGAALLLFAAGAYILYSELPTRPELIAGIVMVACASGVVAGRT